jgi:tRNA dimethylallyltransferase
MSEERAEQKMGLVWAELPRPIVIAGPTAVGKSAVALALAEQIGAEIINADSMQVYRGMDIGTAKATPDEQARVRFHLLDVVTPDVQFTVSEWKAQAESALIDIAERGKRAIICGGTGLYIRALLDDWTLGEMPANPNVRAELERQNREQGSQALHDKLNTVDPETAARLHPNDAVRIIRALEVYETTGTPLSAVQAENRRTAEPRSALRVGLTLPRAKLYEQINRRVDLMLQAGFADEVRRLLQAGYAPTLSAMKSLGYKELCSFWNGEMDAGATAESIKQNTRRFAKRQMTWFRADSLLQWLDVENLTSAEAADWIRQQDAIF